jgi:hypothetical protein
MQLIGSKASCKSGFQVVGTRIKQAMTVGRGENFRVWYWLHKPLGSVSSELHNGMLVNGSSHSDSIV